MIKSALVLGGGTAGLVSALILKSLYQKLDVTIVKSSDIGIIGVGEGSTEHWSEFMSICGISVNELVNETDATYKTGIKFVNWNGDNDYYMHSIHDAYTKPSRSGFPLSYQGLISEGKTHHDLVPVNIHKSLHLEPLESSVYQFHFNTHKLNEFLIKKCKEKNIKIIDAVIENVVIDNDGFVDKIISNDGREFSSDLYIDCSGFKRVISSKLGVKWIDCGEYLPMNSAIAFPTEKTEEIPSHTISTAMSSGWMWRIPTQNRYGNGYVYNDNFITEDQAIAEAQSVFADPIEIGKKIKFTAGYVDKFWVKNCVSVGLSGSFVEPLEASSIGTSIVQAISLANHILTYDRNNLKTVETYNKEFDKVSKNIIDFVQIHYITKRRDTDFWKSCKDLKLTEFNKETLDLFKSTMPSPIFFPEPWLLFKQINWIMVMHGLNMFDRTKLKSTFNLLNNDIIYASNASHEDLKKYTQEQTLYTHRESLEMLKSRNAFTKISFDNE